MYLSVALQSGYSSSLTYDDMYRKNLSNRVFSPLSPPPAKSSSCNSSPWTGKALWCHLNLAVAFVAGNGPRSSDLAPVLSLLLDGGRKEVSSERLLKFLTTSRLSCFDNAVTDCTLSASNCCYVIQFEGPLYRLLTNSMFEHLSCKT